MGFKMFKLFSNLKDRHVIFALILTLVCSYLMVYFFDLHNAFGVRDYFRSEYDTWPFFWYHWFKNGGPIEIIQYLFLGFGALVCIKNSNIGQLNQMNSQDQNPTEVFRFWTLMGVTLILMLIEDAGDPRHTIRVYVQAMAGEEEQGILGTITELVYFTILASIPLYALIRHGKTVLAGRGKTMVYLLGGFFSYALAVGASFAGSAFHSLLEKNLYMITGRYLLDLFVTLGDEKTGELYSQNKDWISFYLMDSPVEESIELIGASLLLAAVISYARLKEESPKG